MSLLFGNYNFREKSSPFMDRVVYRKIEFERRPIVAEVSIVCMKYNVRMILYIYISVPLCPLFHIRFWEKKGKVA